MECFWVAPHAGAWIETGAVVIPMRSIGVAPHAGAWIETGVLLCAAAFTTSPLTQGRGLKLLFCKERMKMTGSPLTQGRGLKPLAEVDFTDNQMVAPHAGAWIETSRCAA